VREETTPFTRERYDEICKRAESMGYVIITKWRKGIKNLRVGVIVKKEKDNAKQV